jgi:hypothetical protein
MRAGPSRTVDVESRETDHRVEPGAIAVVVLETAAGMELEAGEALLLSELLAPGPTQLDPVKPAGEVGLEHQSRHSREA